MGSKIIEGEGDDMDKAKDTGVIGQRREKTKRKPSKNNAKRKNEQGQKEALQKGHCIVCPLTKE
jgi:hypothetical protein